MTGGKMRVAVWRDDTVPKGWSASEESPTHWMPLPIPPDQEMAVERRRAPLVPVGSRLTGERDRHSSGFPSSVPLPLTAAHRGEERQIRSCEFVELSVEPMGEGDPGAEVEA
jgi:hypothetical protein